MCGVDGVAQPQDSVVSGSLLGNLSYISRQVTATGAPRLFRTGVAIPQTLLNGQKMTQPFSSAADTTVTCELDVHVIVGGEPQVTLPAAFHYHGADPYAVRLSIGATSSGTVDWIFALSLLKVGLGRPVGEGNVLVSPRRSSHGPVVRIVVRSRLGSAVLDMMASPVAEFLDRAEELVPAGTEGHHIDIDRVATLLLTTDE